ncbi:helix-turn-helix domain-containing protein [Colwellia sp. Arc7-635]|uniref:helix-turn-helix transcriptional regulator n=1 Tax=Colwellia sp. Arc7-635 TaxID=2497879 RepID=UPI000F84ED1E|nr:helix-turn-helix domain-containing protein [Colwellia sp. Arc7-635]AZQ82707.1 helix-turn-helix domain-containing protein [Colwellia sp. Arc7-635]
MAHFSGIELKNLRKEAGFTQKDLANKIGISRETVVAIENEHPKTINSLSLEVVNTWWGICRASVSEASQLAFKVQVMTFFSLQ